MTLHHDGAVLASIAEKMDVSKNLLASIIETVESDCIRYTASSDAIAVLDKLFIGSGIIAEKDLNTLKIRL